MDKLKWFGLAVLAAVAAVLAFIYGKKPPSVIRAQVRAHNAKGRVLNAEYEEAVKKAEVEEAEERKQHHLERANTLKMDREALEKERARLLEQTGDLDVSDADLARIHNRGSRSSSAAG